MAAVVLVILALLWLNGPARSDAGPALSSPPPLPTPALTSLPTPSSRPTASASPRRRAPVAEPSATQAPAVVMLPVTVLNNSRIHGLAARAADQLDARGWTIRQVGNFTGRIPVPTVYYGPGPGQRRAAEALAREFHAIQRVHPRFAGLPGRGLTLVVTRAWPA